MISVDEALATILATAAKAPVEKVHVGDAAGRVLAADAVSIIDLPPFRASAMDGYAVRFEDAVAGARLTIIAEAAAGSPSGCAIRKGETVRIFTGGAVPDGADHIVIQEDTRREGATIVIAEAQTRRANIRDAGIDFRASEALKRKGERLAPIDLGLIAAANIATIDVFGKPVVAYFDNGDELKEPGERLAHGEIVGSNRFAMDALIGAWGGVARYLGRARDDPAEVGEKFAAARGADILVAVGGASVGDHDHVRSAFADAGGALIFSKVAVRPGKPTWFGKLGDTRVLGLPGNPASAIVCATLFLKPLIAASEGEAPRSHRCIPAKLSSGLKANGPRESYIRGFVFAEANASLSVRAFSNQDSSLYSPLANGNCLIRRAANAPDAVAGDPVECLLYGALDAGGAA